MKNLKFGAFFLGLVVGVSLLVAGVSAQGGGRPSTRERRPAVDVFSLRTGGAQLGVMVSDLDPSTRQPSQANADSLRAGAHVDQVNAGSPAEKAGIKAGDVIVEFDGEKVRSARQFTRLVQETPEGRSVAIALMRDGKRQTVTATPGEPGAGSWEPGVGTRERGAGREFEFRGMPDFNFDMRDLPRAFEYRLPAPGSRLPEMRGRLGVTVQSMTPELEQYFGATNGGALVSSVTPDSAASKAGLKAGDVITSINGRSVSDSDDLMREINDANGEVTITLMRDKKEMTLKAGLGPRASGLRKLII